MTVSPSLVPEMVDGQAHELWADCARAGFVGVNLPEKFGGGGGGISELSAV